MHVYVIWRVCTIPVLTSRIPRIFIVGAGAGLWGIFYLGRVYGHDGSGVLSRTLEFAGMNWMASIFLIAVCLLTADIVTGFGFFLPKSAPSIRALALAAGGLLAIIALVQGLRPPVIQNYEVHLSGLPAEMDGTVIAGLSDMHLGSLVGKRWLEKRISQVQDLHPDMVVLLGDIFEGHDLKSKEMIAAFRGFSAPLGVWAVEGNHDSYGPRSGSDSPVEDNGFKVLHDSWVEIRPGFVLAGVDDIRSRRRSEPGGDPIRKALEGRPEGGAVFLSHRPLRAGEVAEMGVGLMLSGHTHGGQVWPFDYLVRQEYPLLEGRYEVKDMTVIVCRGTGTWGPRMRLWSPGEIVLVTLHTEGI